MPNNKSNDLKAELHKYGFCRSSNAEKIMAPLIILGIITGITALLIYTFHLGKFSWSDAYMPILYLGTAIIAYQQWRENRYEISIDKYYDRLEGANKRLECLEIPKEKMHVYVELDKLEYVIVKYELGFIPAKFAKRAIDNFKCHCIQTNGFQNIVEEVFQESAYLKETKTVVNTICLECEGHYAKKINITRPYQKEIKYLIWLLFFFFLPVKRKIIRAYKDNN